MYNTRRPRELEQRKIQIQIKLHDIHLFEGAIDLLHAKNGRVKIALATMNNRIIIDQILKLLGVKDYFLFVVTFDDVEQPKPDPEAFLRCGGRLDCQPERCVVIEDSIFGVAAAKLANMSCIAVASGAYSLEELKHEDPDLLVDTISERGKILQFIFDGAR